MHPVCRVGAWYALDISSFHKGLISSTVYNPFKREMVKWLSVVTGIRTGHLQSQFAGLLSSRFRPGQKQETGQRRFLACLEKATKREQQFTFIQMWVLNTRYSPNNLCFPMNLCRCLSYTVLVRCKTYQKKLIRSRNICSVDCIRGIWKYWQLL